MRVGTTAQSVIRRTLLSDLQVVGTSVKGFLASIDGTRSRTVGDFFPIG